MRIKNFKLNTDDEVIHKIVGEVLRAFHIEIVEEDRAADFDKFEIENKVQGENVKTLLRIERDGMRKNYGEISKMRPEEREGAEIHRLVKRNLYNIIKNFFKLPGVPYGIMHGVRPTKIIHRWLRQGFGVTSHGVIDREKISGRLRTDYLANYEKASLLTEVAIRQIPFLKDNDPKTIGVYVGIPFCRTRCLYCSFPSNILPGEEKISEFMNALTRDIDAAKNEIRRYGFKVESIYIGGGTPTSLPAKFFEDMMQKVADAFYSESVKEFTVEGGRPDTIDSEKIAVMKKFKVTRVSVNPQTMQDKTLERIGRQHTAEQIVSIFNELRNAGDWKINMDLILGLPGEKISDVRDTLEKVLSLNPDDITIHALALKRGSKLQMRLADKLDRPEDFELPEDEDVRKMSDLAERLLRRQNYLPYYLYRQGYISGQIENIGFCKRGAEGIYNIRIMDERQTILGVGSAATTKVPDLKNERLKASFNAKDLTTYLNELEKYIGRRSELLAEIYKPVEEPKILPEIEKVSENIVAKKVEEISEYLEPENISIEKVEEVSENISAEKIEENSQDFSKKKTRNKAKKLAEKISEKEEAQNSDAEI